MADLKFDANLGWLFTELPFEQRFDAAAAAGFRGVEYPSPYQFPAQRLRSLLDEAGLKQVLINTPMGEPGTLTSNGLACVPSLVDDFRDGVTLALEYATTLNADFIHVVGGRIPQQVSRDRAFAQFVVNIAWAAEQLAGTDVRIVLETQNQQDAPGFILDTQAHAAAVVEALGNPRVGVLLDFYHLHLGEGDCVTVFEDVVDQVFHIQIADPPDRHEPGTGQIDWRPVFDAIRASGYDGWIGCEYRPAAGTVDGLGWMRELAAA